MAPAISAEAAVFFKLDLVVPVAEGGLLAPPLSMSTISSRGVSWSLSGKVLVQRVKDAASRTNVTITTPLERTWFQQ